MITFPESHQDLLNAPVATLATMGHDGYPQVTALWFLFDDDGMLKLSLNTTRQKVKNLQAHPECTLFHPRPGNPYRTLEVRARRSRRMRRMHLPRNSVPNTVVSISARMIAPARHASSCRSSPSK